MNMNFEANTHRDGRTVSLWQQDQLAPLSAVPDTAGLIYDAVIMGAGITGLTTAILLQQQGKKCIILEGHKLGFGTTGGTTAHINTFYDTDYSQIAKDFGEEAAKTSADAAKASIALIQELAAKYAIDCDFECKDGIVFSETEEETKELLKELEASRSADVDVVEVRDNGIPVPFEFAVLYKDQAQFHPLKYLSGLAKAFIELGGVLVEDAFVRDTSKGGEIHMATTDSQEYRGYNLIYATHMPPGITVFDTECAPYRSYVLAIKLKNGDYPKELVYDMKDPYHYIRTHEIDGQPYLVLGGEDHKTGHGDPEASFAALEAYARKYYYVDTIPYRWSAQYYLSIDGMPYIGEMPASDGHVFVATGYNGNGMILGTIAGQIISDAILGLPNEYKEVFNPSRIKPVAGFQEFVKENVDVIYRFFADRLGAEDLESFKDVPPDTGVVVDHQGEKLAVYKDAEGKVTLLSPTCTHAGCIVSFNPAEKSWDCPCHGGRYDLEGQVLCGPPRKNLKAIMVRG
jgi:glycine/D-amino acid oxidase-like deaminating enzyme/nitrite reductase/ring-hydroxylating ferredoxin subunit